MQEYDKFYIGGEWVLPVAPKMIDVINPATEEPCARLALGNEADVDRAVAAAKAAEDFAATPVRERHALLMRIAKVYKERYDDMARAITTEMGAPITLSTEAQTAVGLGHIRTAARVLNNYTFEYRHEGVTIRREAIGVVGLITPWNWPVNQIASKVAPAIAAGCTMVLKPSEISPISAIVFAEILEQAGVPAGVFNLVQGYGPEVGEAMSRHPDITMMSFTGSTRGGVAVARAAADTVKRVGQELGGKSANILLDDEALEDNIRGGLLHVFENTGQSCNAPTRMLIPGHRRAEIDQVVQETCATLKIGDPALAETEMGPLVSGAQFDKVQNLIQAGIDEGATLLAGGVGRPEGVNKGYFARPTVFADVTNDMTIAREEIFGPVLTILNYDSVDQAVEIANDSVYGLAAYVCGQDREQMSQIARQLKAGQVHLNRVGGGTDAPFGGYKQSGNGREKTVWGLEEFLEVKAICGE